VRLEVDWALLRGYIEEVPKYYGKRYYEICETVRRRVSPRDERELDSRLVENLDKSMRLRKSMHLQNFRESKKIIQLFKSLI